MTFYIPMLTTREQSHVLLISSTL